LQDRSSACGREEEIVSLPVFVVSTEQLQADRIALSGDEGRHAAVVKRIRPGERIILTDGRGSAAECSVESVSKSELLASVQSRTTEPAPEPRLIVVQAIPKGDHAERAVDLITEVGADLVVPWAASRNIVTWTGDREAKAVARWRATAHAAAKQSRRLWFPEVSGVHTTEHVAALVSEAALALVLDESAEVSIARIDIPADGDIVLVVGPEGGITPDELEALRTAGARAALLGPTVLRSSTAGVVAAAAVLSRTPRWP
jgi:16S rRNA (uracil1498-N3)-methyltransferase